MGVSSAYANPYDTMEFWHARNRFRVAISSSHVRYSFIGEIAMGDGVNFSIAAGLIRLHMPGVK